MQQHVLVLEHCDAARLLTVGHLLREGYRVTTAVDGIDAWKALTQLGADAIVADCATPRMNGFEFCRRVREDLRFEKTPIVLTCAAAVPVHWRSYCSAVLLKPFDVAALIAVVRNLTCRSSC